MFIIGPLPFALYLSCAHTTRRCPRYSSVPTGTTCIYIHLRSLCLADADIVSRRFSDWHRLAHGLDHAHA